ncbi:peptidoglycan-N-acetylglucosamine deacetylase [Entomortierella parvispora]|uniref:chitin deacetylase n=1 Tax=Entomortierella parvispora TaxID=205924 RepID=A0A9P3HJR7_9FUNG|nr:peptidoglycan-N-acetylglucosamine deacetylase [Entomortierella parvispora]
MVKIIPTLVGLSASLAVVLAHAGHGKFGSLEKRGTAAPEPASCKSDFVDVLPGKYPVLDCIPFVQDSQVKKWLQQYDISKAPVFPLSNDGACPTNTASIPDGQCWWTCQKCTAPNDVTFCPKAGTWGLTYDDGPTPDSERLYDVLKAHGTKATLFIVGSRAISFPNTLKRAYNEGHQIAVHTWSHPMMTSLSNEQIVAELKWTEKAIFDTIGVTPLYWRPPYGDVDNRVRYIATVLGFKTSIWTDGFDTNDWNIPAGTATPQSVVATFKTWLTKIPTMSTGFIVLEHDLFPQEVNVSINGILPLAYADTALTMMPIAKCVGDAAPYKEGAGTFVLGGPAASPSAGSLPGATGSNSGGAAGPTVVSSGKSSDALSLMSQSAPLVMTVAAVGSSMLMAAAGIVF